MRLGSLKNKNRRVCSAVHWAVSIRKLDSLPVNHPKPKIKVRISAEHLRDACLKSLIYSFIQKLNRKSRRCQDPHNAQKKR
jgi:hypothetical protein